MAEWDLADLISHGPTRTHTNRLMRVRLEAGG